MTKVVYIGDVSFNPYETRQTSWGLPVSVKVPFWSNCPTHCQILSILLLFSLWVLQLKSSLEELPNYTWDLPRAVTSISKDSQNKKLLKLRYNLREDSDWGTNFSFYFPKHPILNFLIWEWIWKKLITWKSINPTNFINKTTSNSAIQNKIFLIIKIKQNP